MQSKSFLVVAPVSVAVLLLWAHPLAVGQAQLHSDLPVVTHRRIPESYCELVELGTLHLADAGIALQIKDSTQDLHPTAFSHSLGFLEYAPDDLSDDREDTFYAARNAGFDLRTGQSRQAASTRELPALQIAKDMPTTGCGTVESAHQALAAQPVPEHVYNAAAKDVTAPQIFRQVAPQYSERARRERVQGEVVLTLILQEDGTPTYIFVSRSLDADLDKSALEAVHKWQFGAAVKDGHAVASTINVNVRFGLYYSVR